MASTTAPPAPTTTAVRAKPTLRSNTAHLPFDPLCQKPRQMQAPVTVAAINPARLLRGANLMAFTKGRCGGRGGVWRPQRRPMVDAVVSDHDSLDMSFDSPGVEQTAEQGD